MRKVVGACIAVNQCCICLVTFVFLKQGNLLDSFLQTAFYEGQLGSSQVFSITNALSLFRGTVLRCQTDSTVVNLIATSLLC